MVHPESLGHEAQPQMAAAINNIMFERIDSSLKDGRAGPCRKTPASKITVRGDLSLAVDEVGSVNGYPTALPQSVRLNRWRCRPAGDEGKQQQIAAQDPDHPELLLDGNHGGAPLAQERRQR